ncbi:hypothetical protein D922_03186 [Enterococcus faecalis 06-MB-DW-09]|nr:hypothetical protein D922_03186 [Enterococcus faecalis 06-MB-DW-09]
MWEIIGASLGSESIEPLPYKEEKNTRYRKKRMPLVTSIFRQSSLNS